MLKRTKVILLSISFVAIFVIFFVNLNKSVRIEQSILGFTHQLHTLRTQNILIFEQVSDDFKEQDFNRLDSLIKELATSWTTFSNTIKKSFADQPTILRQIAKIDEEFDKRRQLYLDYEADKEALVKSVLYLIDLKSQIKKKRGSLTTHYCELIDSVLKNSIYYNTGFEQIQKSIQITLDFLDKHASDPSFQAPLATKNLQIFHEKASDMFRIIKQIRQDNIARKLNTLEELFFENVNNERNNRKFFDILLTTISFIMLVGFLIAFFKTHRDNEKILYLQEENELTNTELLEKMQLLKEYKKALDASSIVSKTDLRGFITFVNDRFCDISGYTREELLGKPHNIVRHEDMPQEVFQELWQTIQNKEIFHKIIKNKKKNGNYYYVDSTIIPILDINGKILEYFAVRYDVTDLMDAKEEALAAEKAKSAFLATMSHELRTPLNAVIGFSQILLAKKDIPEETLKDFVHKINVAGKHLLNIVNNILDFTKIESQRMELNRQHLDLNSLIEDAVTLVETSANTKKLSLQQEGFDSVSIFADEQLLKQVLLNILSNAVKFTSEGKEIRISYEKTPTHHIIDICDEGIGLSQNQVERLFKPFAQIEEHQNSSIKGTGLGLAISKKIMQLHGGDITVESEIDKGSCFKIFLPLSKESR